MRLPHPKRDEPVIGTCECGLMISYEWDQHEWAVDVAKDHIAVEDKSEAVELAMNSGERSIVPGRSL